MNNYRLIRVHCKEILRLLLIMATCSTNYSHTVSRMLLLSVVKFKGQRFCHD